MSRGGKRKGQLIDGVLLLDKAQGVTSNKALQQCRFLLNAQKGGHTGALDPLATGLLPLCFGKATKISSFLLRHGKTYSVSATLGEVTDTGDADGRLIESRAVSTSESDIRRVMALFVGEHDQFPPKYSALKINGQPMYKLARKGIEFERKARRVTAYDIRFTALQDDVLRFEVDCSSGYYVRSLVEDIGRVLGCGAHVRSLRRTRIGQLSVDDALTFKQFQACETMSRRLAKLHRADLMLLHFAEVILNHEQQEQLRHGRSIKLDRSGDAMLNTNEPGMVYPESGFEPGESYIRVYGPDNLFLGLGQFNAEGELAPRRLFI